MVILVIMLVGYFGFRGMGKHNSTGRHETTHTTQLPHNIKFAA